MHANKDIHTQIPPKSLSISLNILKTSNMSRGQYIFDLKKREIARVVDEEVIPSLLKVASYFGDENTIDILDDTLKKAKNVSDEARLKCYQAITGRLNKDFCL
ncbi:hypothetical protein [Pseudoalteromonas rubra]|nr:hypothetical protein [Pseudoalteromonas rubra]TMP26789.1 hypothetical protein CWC00_23810 [Pseudoalteromonas rubra]